MVKKGQATRGPGIHAISRWRKGRLRGEDRRMFWKQHRTAEDAAIRKVYRDMGLESEQERQRLVDLATVGQSEGWPDFVTEIMEQGDTLSPRERAILYAMGTR